MRTTTRTLVGGLTSVIAPQHSDERRACSDCATNRHPVIRGPLVQHGQLGAALVQNASFRSRRHRTVVGDSLYAERAAVTTGGRTPPDELRGDVALDTRTK